LADDNSRETLVEVLAYWILGSDHIRLSLNDSRYRADLALINSKLAKERTGIQIPLVGTELRKYTVEPLGFPIVVYNLPLGIHTVFTIQQYAYAGGVSIRVAEGDVVIDGGGCWGDTALYFAHLAGAGGKVVSFEFEPNNLRVYGMNLDLNPTLRSRITVVERALWDAPGTPLNMSANGPGTSVGRGTGTGSTVLTETIDHLVEGGTVERVNFIKLDIEGAEQAALKGAEQTLKRFRPKLAIALYHSLDDFVRIPQYLDSLGLGYRFYLRHCTIYGEETILYAVSEGTTGST
jgi:FkbM family methyltransferase